MRLSDLRFRQQQRREEPTATYYRCRDCRAVFEYHEVKSGECPHCGSDDYKEHTPEIEE
jgi:rRNA maturation endonuclease Nob1